MMKEGTGEMKEEDGDRNATEDGKKTLHPEIGMTDINPGVVGYGQGYCYFLSEPIICL